MQTKPRMSLSDIETKVRDIVSEQLGVERSLCTLDSRMIEDLGCDSLDLIELFMDLEDSFSVTLPDRPPNDVYKSVFTRRPFRVRDLAEIIYLQQGTGKPIRKGWRNRVVEIRIRSGSFVPFTQLSGRLEESAECQSLFETLDCEGLHQHRRRTDGMRCICLPSAKVAIGSDCKNSCKDERPVHKVSLDSFMIDAEPVSTSAFCRFLNSIEVDDEELSRWILRNPDDDRIEHMLIQNVHDTWKPVAECEQLPMILVSWFGASAYAVWANGQDWSDLTLAGQFLPTEAQWEYASQGAYDEAVEPTQSEAKSINSARHVRGMTYQPSDLPLRPVQEPLGTSTFGLHHMAGNVWQWCRDWYDSAFYQSQSATHKNVWNDQQTGVRSERGGSWVGPSNLCRTTYRRGRAPEAFGRCLGFRCVSRTLH